MRHRPRLDANHTEIVDGLRQIGATVQSLAGIGGGCPDILVGWHGVNILMEIKDGSKPASARKLTDDEQVWIDEWRGGDVWVVESLSDALFAVYGAVGLTCFADQLCDSHLKST